MITPKQSLLLDRLKTLPAFQELVQRLDLEPAVSEEYRRSVMISDRVEQLMNHFEEASKSPHNKRIVFQDPSSNPTKDVWLRTEEINAYLESIYGPKPWKYPLSHAPF